MTEPSDEQTTTEPVKTEIPQLKKKSVGGWLLFLCLVLAIISPLMTLYSLVTSFAELEPQFVTYPGFKTLFYVDTVLSTILMIFSIRAGVSLWKVLPGAVTRAKNYLYLYASYIAVSSIIPFVVGLPSMFTEAMTPIVLTNIIRSVIFFSVWLAYLNKSKRVKETFELDKPLIFENDGKTMDLS